MESPKIGATHIVKLSLVKDQSNAMEKIMLSRSGAELDTHVYTYLTLPTLITANAWMDTEQSSDSLSTGMRNCVVNLGDSLARFLLFVL